MHSNRLGSQKASTCSRDKSQCHYHWLLSRPQLSATFRGSSLITCSFSPSPAGFGELPLDQSHHLCWWMHPRSPDFLAHVLPPSTRRGDLNWENNPNVIACRQVCGVFFWLMVDVRGSNLLWEVLSLVLLCVLGCIEEQKHEQARRRKSFFDGPVSVFCPVWVLAPTYFHNQH